MCIVCPQKATTQESLIRQNSLAQWHNALFFEPNINSLTPIGKEDYSLLQQNTPPAPKPSAAHFAHF
jgi:hypothetical protein